MRHAGALAALLLVCSFTRTASAHADVRGIISGSGFNDRTPVQPIGGNPGTTLGEQRRLALQRAFSLWSDRLDSSVPIEVAFEFEALGCMEGGTILGGAGPVSAFADIPGGQAGLSYVSALANSLAGKDLDPGEPDIAAHFNSSVDTECKRQTGGGFYYGFDAKPDGAADFIAVVLHELAHGLGITALVNVATGEAPTMTMMTTEATGSIVDSYTAQLHDLKLDRSWAELSASERKASAASARGVVWSGARARRLVNDAFALGTPTLDLERPAQSWSGAVSDVELAQSAAEHSVSGQLVAADSCNPQGVRDAIVLFPDSCKPLAAARAALSAGAAGALVVIPWPFDTPAMPVDADADPSETKVELPVLSIAVADAELLRRAARQQDQRVTLGGNGSQPIGADAQGRPFLFASQPVSTGSTISHLDELVRPNQLMEPYASERPSHALGFTAALLQDIGWKLRCGDGRMDEGEECDDGEQNSDFKPDACRSDCQRARCGDGVKDHGEACDAVGGNDDRAADGCRSNCMAAHCGDGVLDRGEECDRGDANSDTKPGACRSSCELPHCGDGVTDPLEECDEGKNNGDGRANACRSSCRAPRCGDGVVDPGENCDAGERNSDTQPGACRRDCEAARCGDHVVDDGEACDSTAGCSAECRPMTAMTTGASSRIAQRSDAAEPSPERDRSSETADTTRPAACSCQSVSARTVSIPQALPWLSLAALALSRRARPRNRNAAHGGGAE